MIPLQGDVARAENPGMLSAMPRRRPLAALALVAALLVPAATATSQEADPAPAPNPDGEIVGGVPADPGEYPFLVALLSRRVGNRSQAQFCGGSLISPDTVLTAAHCVQGTRAADLDVLAGSHTLAPGGGGLRVPVRKVRIHPGFEARTFVNDVAILQLGTNLPFEVIPTIQPGQGPLATPGTMATVTGWGATNENGFRSVTLREVDVPILSNAQCASKYGSDYRAVPMLCAGDLNDGGEDACQGDSGGPFFVPDGADELQVGIVSWGVGCARRNFPGVYTRVASFRGFINPYLDPDTPPRNVTNLRAQRVSANAFRITWRPPVFDGGTRITRFRVRIPSLGRNHGVLGSQTRFTVRNLPQGPRRIEVVAVNGVGTGPARALNVNV